MLYVETALLSFDISRLESLKDRSWVLNIHVNNISEACHNAGVALFADDTEIPFSSKDVGKAEYIIDKDLKSINQWFSNNGLIGGFHAISGDTNNNGEMNKCWWTNKVS